MDKDRRNNKTGSSHSSRTKREQPRKDSSSKRINFDNERLSKFEKDRELAKGKMPKRAASNDFSWYNHNPELIAGAARIPDAYIAGRPIPATKYQFSTPTLMRLVYNPVYATGDLGVMRQAMNDQYSFVVHANSRNYNYAPVDMYLLQLAGVEVFAAIAMGLRVYGVMEGFSAINATLPEAFVRAFGFQYSDLRNNYSRMWLDLNRLIAAAKQIWIPTTFSLTDRRFWMNSKIYMDSESIKDQYYVFVQQGFYQLQLDGSKGTSLKRVNWLDYAYHTSEGDFDSNDFMLYASGASLEIPGSNTTTLAQYKSWDQYIEFVMDLITPITNSQDRGMIYGDLLNAYGTSGIFAISPIDFNYRTEIAYEPEVLTEIANATVSPFIPQRLTQEPNSGSFQTLWFNRDKHQTTTKPAGVTLKLPIISNPVLNFKQMAAPTPELLTVATRLQTLGLSGSILATSTRGSGKVLGHTTNFAEPTSISTDACPGTFGTEIIGAIDILGTVTAPYPSSYVMGSDTYFAWISLRAGGYYTTPNYAAAGIGAGSFTDLIYSWLPAFDWRPLQYHFLSESLIFVAFDNNTPSVPPASYVFLGDASQWITPFYIAGELEQILCCNFTDIKNLNDIAFQSMLGVPINLSGKEKPKS